MESEDLTGKIIGCAMQVHSTLGNGFPSAAKGLPTARQEVIYQRALAIEMAEKGLTFAREKEIDIYYRGQIIGSRRVDFLVEDNILVELKALTQLEAVHLAQAKNYLEAFNLNIGLLINFGETSLRFKRLQLSWGKSPKSKNPSNPGSDNG